MAYAAIMTLKQNLQNILQDPQKYSNIPCDKKDIESFNAKVGFLQCFLEKYPSHNRNGNATNFLEGRIRDAAFGADDLMDIYSSNSSHDYKGFPSFMFNAASKNNSYLNKEETIEPTDIKLMAKKFDSLIAEVMKFEEQMGFTKTFFQPRTALHPGLVSSITKEYLMVGFDDNLVEIKDQLAEESSTLKIGKVREDFDRRNAVVSSTTKDLMVGFKDHLKEIKERLAEDSSTLKILSIVGMGGIGKTTLAKHVHKDPGVVDHFDIRVWVTVSQSYSVRDIMLGMLDSMGTLTEETQEASNAHLEIFVRKNFMYRRYLITLDDIWDTKAWDSLKKMFPDDVNGSRIMLTTRIANVAKYARPSWTPHLMNPLKDEQSWMLLQAKVFGDKPCPLYLQEIGKTIARDCGGLPLSLVVIGGLLSKVEKTQPAWQSVAGNVNSLLTSSGDQCSEILRLSYNYLPQYLKACFLYMGVFPKSHEVRVSKLTKMWVAEGFLREADDQRPEDVAQGCVEDLFDRSLILMCKRNFEGRIKAFRMHDLLLDFCLEEAKSEEFLQLPRRRVGLLASHLATERRISIHPMRKKFKHVLIPSNYISCCTPFLRSLVCVGKCYIDPLMFSEFELLRLLDVTQVVFPEFPHQVLKLRNLRYIAFLCNGDIPASITELWNLQTLIIIRNLSGRSKYHLPVEIWSMTHLRHVRCDRAHLPDPTGLHIKQIVFENLQTLSGLLNLIFTEEMLQRIPNIKKIDVVYESGALREWSDYQFENIGNLHQLEALKIRAINPEIGLFPGWISPTRFEFALPRSLKTLTLAGVGIPWDDLAVIGSLPHLQVLKLLDHACLGTEWKPNEEEFCELNTLVLESLKLKHWEADSRHFPSLQRLIIRRCCELDQIPSGMGESLSLDMIELRGCKASVFDSAENIQKQQVSNGTNIGFRVICHETSGWHEVSQVVNEVVNDVLLPQPQLALYCSYSFTSRWHRWRTIGGVMIYLFWAFGTCLFVHLYVEPSIVIWLGSILFVYCFRGCLAKLI